MNEMLGPDTDPHQMEDGIDRLLRRSMAAAVPILPPDFDQRVMCEVRRRARPLDRYRRILLGGYGLVSLVVSAIVMRGQGLEWVVVSETILTALALVAVTLSAWRVTHRHRSLC